MYIRCQASKELGIGRRNILFYVLCILYILSTTSVVLDTTLSLLLNKVSKTLAKLVFILTIFFVYNGQITRLGDSEESLLFRFKALNYTSNTINGMCNFISQGVLVCISLYHLLYLS